MHDVAWQVRNQREALAGVALAVVGLAARPAVWCAPQWLVALQGLFEAESQQLVCHVWSAQQVHRAVARRVLWDARRTLAVSRMQWLLPLPVQGEPATE